ncbi:hypothetical protein DIPPA_35943 [Diplonema papillatum]|nr:hypothetical protein DIPPA_35943 [Diplonema papillatum]
MDSGSERTFLEEETGEPRADLFKKLATLSIDLATEKERQTRTITKLRYMRIREELSSSAQLGFRIDGIAGLDCNEDLTRTRSKEAVAQVLASYLANVAPGDVGLQKKIVRSFCDRLDHLHAAARRSAFFKGHEMVGSSLLFVADVTGASGASGVWLIDLANYIGSGVKSPE